MPVNACRRLTGNMQVGVNMRMSGTVFMGCSALLLFLVNNATWRGNWFGQSVYNPMFTFQPEHTTVYTVCTEKYIHVYMYMYMWVSVITIGALPAKFPPFLMYVSETRKLTNFITAVTKQNK